MKPNIITTTLFAFLFAAPIFAQDRTTVNALSSEISDNLDLRAIASIFGEARDLEDFERQINDPKMQISNLDLNDDNQVDYLRVIESVEGNTHLVIIQSVLGMDSFQDVATIEVERDANNQVQIQVVGDVYMYGENYIYEPVYVSPPFMFNVFWSTGYHPYASMWYWNYYPTYYHVWNPYPVFRYRRNVHNYINVHNHYNYVNVRRSQRAPVMLSSRRANYGERTYPTRAFSYRNTTVKNRYELVRTRNAADAAVRNNANPGNVRSANSIRNNTTRPQTNSNSGSNPVRTNQTPRTNNMSPVRNDAAPRTETNIRTNSNPVRSGRPQTNIQPNASPATPRAETNIRTNPAPVRQNIQMNNNAAPRMNQQRAVPQNNNQARSIPQRQNAGGRNAGGGNNERGGRR